MKKIVSLVALAGMFMLMSFGNNVKDNTLPTKVITTEAAGKDCFTSASEGADAWGYVFGNNDPEYVNNVFIWLYEACADNDVDEVVITANKKL